MAEILFGRYSFFRKNFKTFHVKTIDKKGTTL